MILTETFASGKGFSMFTYDDGSFILYRYVKDEIRPSHVKVYTTKDAKILKDTTTGWEIKTSSITVFENWQEKTYNVADVILEPGVFKKYRWE